MANAYSYYRNRADQQSDVPASEMAWNIRKDDIADHGRGIYRALGGYESKGRNDTVTLNKLLKMRRKNFLAGAFSEEAYLMYKNPMSKKLLKTLQSRMETNMRDAARADIPYLGPGKAPNFGTRLVRPSNIVKVFKRLAQYETQHRKETIARFERAMRMKQKNAAAQWSSMPGRSAPNVIQNYFSSGRM